MSSTRVNGSPSANPEHLPSKALERALTRHSMHFADGAWKGLWIEQKFTCDRGHVTIIAPRNLIRQREQGCRVCANEAATSRGHELAAAADSRWLDAPWRGTAARYRLRCKAGHDWSCGGQALQRGARCTECKLEHTNLPGTMLRDGLERLGAAAREYGGVCMSDQYDGVTGHYLFRCGAGHRFTKTGNAVLYGGVWCPECPRDRIVLVDGLQRLQRAAKDNGGVCLSTEFRGTGAKHRFRCSHGHVWSAQAGTILYSSGWCRRCRYDGMMAPEGLERLKNAAAQRCGQCLSRRYGGYHGKHEFKCEAGHRWKTTAQSVLRGAWCPHCAEAQAGSALLLKDGLEQLRARAAEPGGECLDEAYLGTVHRYKFRCSKGHEWSSKGGAVLRGRWCQRCAIDAQRCTIEEARAVAHERGGECLSEIYVNARAHLVWQCHRGHVWPANFDNVRNKGKWCPDCKVLNMISSAKSKARARLEAR